MSTPPHLLPAGTRLAAGLGVSTVLADMDFETFSEAGYVFNAEAYKFDRLPNATGTAKGLGIVGAAVYAQHPSTEILCLAYNLKDGRGVRVWRPGMPPPLDLLDHIYRGGLVEAHNSGFEWWIWNYVGVPRHGWPPLQIAQCRCSMAKARAHGLPGALGNLGEVLQLVNQKDKEGKRLLDKFSVPQKPTKKDRRLRHHIHEEPVDGIKLLDYCVLDTVSESEASARTPDLDGEELEYWIMDQEINRRGVAVDREGILNCIAIIEQAHAQYNVELGQITGGIKASENKQLIEWLLIKHGIFQPSMEAEEVETTLKRTDLVPEVRRVLEIRAAVASASVKKVFAMRNQLTRAGRLHDLFNYHGARTGRPTGEGPQPTNLPKTGPKLLACICGKHHAPGRTFCPWCGFPVPPASKPVEWSSDIVEEVLEVCKQRSYHALEHYYGQAMFAVSGCLRGLFVAAPGHKLICSDFNAIEGVVTAQLAGEEWRLEVFRTHGKIYEMSAAKITGVPFEEMMEYRKRTGSHHPMRNKIGKFAELALGFGGWVNAMVNFGADEFLNEQEMKDAIVAWREASPMIVELWGGQYRGLPWDDPNRNGKPYCTAEFHGLEGAAINAVLYPGQVFTYRDISYLTHNDVLYCRLPSGRTIDYQKPRLSPGTLFNRPEYPTLNLSYSTWNTNPKYGAVGWVSKHTYGGQLAENVVQATARDIQRYAGLQLKAAGYPIVLHVYDENVAEVPEDYGSLEEFERIMKTMPPWAAGWPINASGGWVGKRYRKD